MFEGLRTAIAGLGLSVQTLAMIGVGLGVMLALLGVSGAFVAKNPVLIRLAEQSVRSRDTAIEAGLLRPSDADPTGLMRGLIPVDRKDRTQVQRQLAHAGMNGPHAVRNFYLIRLCIGFLLPCALFALIAASRESLVTLPAPIAHQFGAMSQIFLLQVLCGLVAVGFFGPVYWLRARVSERQRAIEEAFPNVLDLLQISVESGLGLDAAMIRVANETAASSPAISEELMITQREIQAGRGRDKALLDMAARTGVAQVNSFANVVLQSLNYGSSIADALTVYAEEMRQWRELRAQEMANKLPVKMSAVMASLMLPALLMLALGPVVIRYMHFMHQ
ncbi:MAG: type II secretion system F family protein [Cypionkella sp.]